LDEVYGKDILKYLHSKSGTNYKIATLLTFLFIFVDFQYLV